MKVSDERAREIRESHARGFLFKSLMLDLLDDREQLLRELENVRNLSSATRVRELSEAEQRIEKLERVVEAARRLNEIVIPLSEESVEFEPSLDLANALRSYDEESA